MRVLLVDDDNVMRRIAALSLARSADMDVLEAESGLAGLGKAVRDRPDVILLDLVMPDLDGLATLRLLKANARTASIPVIMLTADAADRDVQPLYRLGAAGAIAKPFDPRRLAADVHHALDTASPAPLAAQA